MTEKIENVNKIKGHKTKIESIKDATKRNTEELRIEKINKLNKIKKKTVIKELKIEVKFNELATYSGIRLLKETKKSILNNPEYISNGKNLIAC